MPEPHWLIPRERVGGFGDIHVHVDWTATGSTPSKKRNVESNCPTMIGRSRDTQQGYLAEMDRQLLAVLGTA